MPGIQIGILQFKYAERLVVGTFVALSECRHSLVTTRDSPGHGKTNRMNVISIARILWRDVRYSLRTLTRRRGAAVRGASLASAIRKKCNV